MTIPLPPPISQVDILHCPQILLDQAPIPTSFLDFNRPTLPPLPFFPFYFTSLSYKPLSPPHITIQAPLSTLILPSLVSATPHLSQSPTLSHILVGILTLPVSPKSLKTSIV
jgi:hypothetical protein